MGVKKMKDDLVSLDDDRLLKPDQICEILGIKYRTLRELIYRGELGPIVYVGRMIRMKPEALKAWINRREQK